VALEEMMGAMASASCRSLSFLPLPGGMLLGPMKVADWIQRLLPFRLPVNFQAVYVSALAHSCDDSAARTDLGIEPLPLEDTLSDTVRWMVQQGHLSPNWLAAYPINGIGRDAPQ